MQLQEYFDQNFPKEKSHVIFDNVPNDLEGEELKLDGFLSLTYVDVKKCPQIKKISINNCPNLEVLEFNSEITKMVVDKNKCSCGDNKLSLIVAITSILMSFIVIGVLLYRRKNQNNNGK